MHRLLRYAAQHRSASTIRVSPVTNLSLQCKGQLTLFNAACMSTKMRRKGYKHGSPDTMSSLEQMASAMDGQYRGGEASRPNVSENRKTPQDKIRNRTNAKRSNGLTGLNVSNRDATKNSLDSLTSSVYSDIMTEDDRELTNYLREEVSSDEAIMAQALRTQLGKLYDQDAEEYGGDETDTRFVSMDRDLHTLRDVGDSELQSSMTEFSLRTSKEERDRESEREASLAAIEELMEENLDGSSLNGAEDYNTPILPQQQDEGEEDAHVPEVDAEEFVTEIVYDQIHLDSDWAKDSRRSNKASRIVKTEGRSRDDLKDAKQLMNEINQIRQQGARVWKNGNRKQTIDLREKFFNYFLILKGSAIKNDQRSAVSAYSTAKSLIRELLEFQRSVDKKIESYKASVQLVPHTYKEIVERDPLQGASLSSNIVVSDKSGSLRRVRDRANELFSLGVAPNSNGRFVFFSPLEWNAIGRAFVDHLSFQEVDDLCSHILVENTFHIPQAEALSILAHMSLALAKRTSTKKVGVAPVAARASLNILFMMFPGANERMNEPLTEAVAQRLGAGGQFVYALELLDVYLSKSAGPNYQASKGASQDKEVSTKPLTLSSANWSVFRDRIPINWPFAPMLHGCALNGAVDEALALFRAIRAQTILPLDREAFLDCISPIKSSGAGTMEQLLPPINVLKRMVHVLEDAQKLRSDELKIILDNLPAEVFFSETERRLFLSTNEGKQFSKFALLPPVKDASLECYEGLLTVFASAGRSNEALSVLQILLKHARDLYLDQESSLFTDPLYMPFSKDVSVTSVSAFSEPYSQRLAQSGERAIVGPKDVPIISEKCLTLALEACSRAGQHTDVLRVLMVAELGLVDLPPAPNSYNDANEESKQLINATRAFNDSQEGKALQLARKYVNQRPGHALFQLANADCKLTDFVENFQSIPMSGIQDGLISEIGQKFTWNEVEFIKTGAFFETPLPKHQQQNHGEIVSRQVAVDALKYLGASDGHAALIHSYLQPIARHLDPFVQFLAPIPSHNNITVVALSQQKFASGIDPDTTSVSASTLAAMGAFGNNSFEQRSEEQSYMLTDVDDEVSEGLSSARTNPKMGRGKGVATDHPYPNTPSPRAPLYKLLPLQRGPLQITLSMKGHHFALKSACAMELVSVASVLFDRIKKQFELNRIAIARLQSGLSAFNLTSDEIEKLPELSNDPKTRKEQISAMRLRRSQSEPRYTRTPNQKEAPLLPPLLFSRPIVPPKKSYANGLDSENASNVGGDPIYAIIDRTDAFIANNSPTAVRLAHCQATGRPSVENVRVWELIERRAWPPIKPANLDDGKRVARADAEFAIDPNDIKLLDLLANATINRAYRAQYEAMLNFYTSSIVSMLELYENEGRIEHVLSLVQLTALHLLPLVRASAKLSYLFPPYFAENVLRILYSGVRSASLRDAPVATLGQLDQLDRALVMNPELALNVELRRSQSMRSFEFTPLLSLYTRSQRQQAQRHYNIRKTAERKSQTNEFGMYMTNKESKRRNVGNTTGDSHENLCYPVGLPVPGSRAILEPIQPSKLWKLRRDAYTSAMISFARLPAKHKLMSIATFARPEFGPELLTQMRVNGMLFAYAVDQAYGCVSVANALAAATPTKDLIPAVLRTPRLFGKDSAASSIHKFARYAARAKTSTSLLSQHSSSKNISPAMAEMLGKIQAEEAQTAFKQLHSQRLPDYLDFSHVHGMQPDIATFTAHFNIIASQGLINLQISNPDLIKSAAATATTISGQSDISLPHASKKIGTAGTTIVNKGKTFSKRSLPNRIWEQLMLSAMPYYQTPFLKAFFCYIVKKMDINGSPVDLNLLTTALVHETLSEIEANPNAFRDKLFASMSEIQGNQDKSCPLTKSSTTTAALFGREGGEALSLAMPLIESADTNLPSYLAHPLNPSEFSRNVDSEHMLKDIGRDLESDIEHALKNKWDDDSYHPFVSSFDSYFGLHSPADLPPILSMQCLQTNNLANSGENKCKEPDSQIQYWSSSLKMRFAFVSQAMSLMMPNLKPRRPDLLPQPKTFESYISATVQFDSGDRAIAVKKAIQQMLSPPFSFGLSSRTMLALVENAGKQRSSLAAIISFRVFIQCLAAEVRVWEGGLSKSQLDRLDGLFPSSTSLSKRVDKDIQQLKEGEKLERQLPSSCDTLPSDVECALLMLRLSDPKMPSILLGGGKSSLDLSTANTAVEECIQRCSVVLKAPSSRGTILSSVLIAAKTTQFSSMSSDAGADKSVGALLPFANENESKMNQFQLPRIEMLEGSSHHMLSHGNVSFVQAVMTLAFALEQSSDIGMLRALHAWLKRIERVYECIVKNPRLLHAIVPSHVLAVSQVFTPSHSTETLNRLTQVFYGPSMAMNASVLGPATSLAYQARMIAHAPKDMLSIITVPSYLRNDSGSAMPNFRLTHETLVPLPPPLVILKLYRLKRGGSFVPNDVYASMISIIERSVNQLQETPHMASIKKNVHAFLEKVFAEAIMSGRMKWWQDTNSPQRGQQFALKYLMLDLHLRLPLAALALRVCMNDLYTLFKRFAVRSPEKGELESEYDRPVLSIGMGNAVPRTRRASEILVNNQSLSDSAPASKAKPTDDLFATMTSLVKNKKSITPKRDTEETKETECHDMNASELRSMFQSQIEAQKSLIPTASTVDFLKATEFATTAHNYLLASPEIVLEYALNKGGLLLSVGSGTRAKPAVVRSLVWNALTKGLAGIVLPVKATFFAPNLETKAEYARLNLGVIHIKPEDLYAWLHARYVLEFGTAPLLQTSFKHFGGPALDYFNSDEQHPHDSIGAVQAGSLRLIVESKHALSPPTYVSFLRDVVKGRIESGLPVPQPLLDAVTKQLASAPSSSFELEIHAELKQMLSSIKSR